MNYIALKLLPKKRDSGKESTCPMQERQVQSLVQEDPTSGGATNPGHHNY